MTNTSPVFNTVVTELTNFRAAIVKFFAKLLGLGKVIVSTVETEISVVENVVVNSSNVSVD
jgi:hypothetical protein